jgi:hypothetical protein
MYSLYLHLALFTSLTKPSCPPEKPVMEMLMYGIHGPGDTLDRIDDGLA